MIDDELMSQYMEDDEPVVEKTQAEKDADAFMKKLADSKAIIQAEGGFAGLCEFCFETGKLYVKRSDDYEGVQYKIDNEIPTIQKCFHGRDIDEEMPF